MSDRRAYSELFGNEFAMTIIVAMACAVMCLWLCLRPLVLKRTKPGLWWRLTYCAPPLLVSLMICWTYIEYLVRVYRYIRSHRELW